MIYNYDGVFNKVLVIELHVMNCLYRDCCYKRELLL